MIQSPFLSYATVKEGMDDITSIASVVEPTHVSHAIVINNVCILQGLKLSVISYANN